MLRFVRSALIFCLQTAILAGVLFGLYHLRTTRDPVLRMPVLTLDGEEVLHEWPIQIGKKNRVIVEGILRNPNMEFPIYTITTQDCPKEVLFNDKDITNRFSCGKTASGTVNLGDILQDGDNTFRVRVEETDDLATFDIRVGTGSQFPSISNLQYIWNDDAPYRTKLPIKINMQQIYSFDFVMNVPKLHANTYDMKLDGCIRDLQINGLQVMEKNGQQNTADANGYRCKGGKVHWGKYLHPGDNVVHMNIYQNNGRLAFDLQENESDVLILVLKGLMVLSVGLYGILRLP